MGDYGYYGIPWVSMGVRADVWGFRGVYRMGVWININSRWVYLCVVYRWYVFLFMGICDLVRICGSLWRASGNESK